MLLFSFKIDVSLLHLILKLHQYIRFEILVVVTVKNTIYWDAMPSALANLLKFHRTILSPSSGSKKEPSKHCYRPGVLFDADDEGSTVLRNVCKLLPDYLVSHSRR
jgi:hypothetical protein